MYLQSYTNDNCFLILYVYYVKKEVNINEINRKL